MIIHMTDWVLVVFWGLYLFTIFWDNNVDEELFYYFVKPEFSSSQLTLSRRALKTLTDQTCCIRDKSCKTDEMPVIVRWDRLCSEPDQRPKIITCGDIKCNVSVFPQRVPLDSLGAYLFHLLSIDFSDLPLPRCPNHVLWSAILPESPKDMLFLHETVLKLFNYSSTFSRYSDVPLYRHLPNLDNITNTKYFVKTSKKNTFLEEIAPIMFLQTNCGSLSNREVYVEKLMKFQKVDSYGPCLNNKKLPKELGGDYLQDLLSENLLEFMAKYKFVIAIENCVCEDYLTEKFWRAILAGVVPIYFGCPTIREWLPNSKSAILLQDFPTPKLLSAHIDELMRDDDLYEVYLQHKTKGLISNVKLINKLKETDHKKDTDREFICFLCDKLHRMGEEPENRVINKSHYDCPTPISALTQNVDPNNVYVKVKYSIVNTAQKLYNTISNNSGY